MEDPSEDIFRIQQSPLVRGQVFALYPTASGKLPVSTPRNVECRRMPAPRRGGYNQLRETVYSILASRLFVCERAVLPAICSGHERAADRLDTRFPGQSMPENNRVVFSQEDIEEASVNFLTDALAAFVFTDRYRTLLTRKKEKKKKRKENG